MQRTTAAFLALPMLFATACGGANDAEVAGPASGAIVIDGSSTVFPVTQLAAEEFSATNEVDLAVGQSGTGGGFAKFCAGEVQIADASRPIKDEEAALCDDAGITYHELLVGLDGISVVAPAGFDGVDCLDFDQLADTWTAGSTVTAWSDIDPSFPSDDLELYGPGPDSGTFDFFVEQVLGDGERPRTDYVASEDDNVLVQGIAGSGSGLGYFGFAYYIENEAALHAIALDAGDGCTTPTVETIADGTYPLSRPLFIYVSDAALQNETTASFVRFYIENAERLSAEVGYVAAPEAEMLANLERLDGVAG